MNPSRMKRNKANGRVATKHGDPKARALKAAKAITVGASKLKKKTKKVRTSSTFHRPKTLKKKRNPNSTTYNTLVFIADIHADNQKKTEAAVKNMYGRMDGTNKAYVRLAPDAANKEDVSASRDQSAY
ncbi:hypothetical protein MKW94_021504 [Papaver nudicaule]|uniref:Large ribosomal subunit protein uL23 N-terminal domain-containing protein n=1 Tax=Papaver nudicaule TaxID=74823 RepID=A0AA41V680_PAPNU|nr:hypothetical protein [Papaver nudicaule]